MQDKTNVVYDSGVVLKDDPISGELRVMDPLMAVTSVWSVAFKFCLLASGCWPAGPPAWATAGLNEAAGSFGTLFFSHKNWPLTGGASARPNGDAAPWIFVARFAPCAAGLEQSKGLRCFQMLVYGNLGWKRDPVHKENILNKMGFLIICKVLPPQRK